MPVTLCFDFGNTRKKVAVFHDDEMKEGKVTLKNMRNGEQQLLSLQEVIQKLI